MTAMLWRDGADFISGAPYYTDNGADDGEGTIGVVVSGEKGDYKLDFHRTE